MRFIRVLLLFAWAVCGSSTAVHADEARTAVLQADKAMNDVPAYRITSQSTQPDTGKSVPAILECITSGTMHTRTVTENGFVYETFIDGKRACVSSGGNGHFVELPENQRSQFFAGHLMWLLLLLAQTDAVKLAGHEEINGAMASLYTFATDSAEKTEALSMEMHKAVKLWISDQDHRPLKMETESHGEFGPAHGPGTKINTRTTSTFEYDPSIKIVFPNESMIAPMSVKPTVTPATPAVTPPST